MDISVISQAQQAKIAQEVSLATTKKALDQQEIEGQQVMQLIQSAAPVTEMQTQQAVTPTSADSRIGSIINTTA